MLERPASSRMGPSRYGGDESRVAATKDGGSDYVDDFQVVDNILRNSDFSPRPVGKCQGKNLYPI